VGGGSSMGRVFGAAVSPDVTLSTPISRVSDVTGIGLWGLGDRGSLLRLRHDTSANVSLCPVLENIEFNALLMALYNIL